MIDFLVGTGIWCVSACWSMASSLVQLLVRFNVIKPTTLGPRVISVGNLQVGGAGKTPLVVQIAREGISRNLSICILCRGYGGQWESTGGVLLPGAEQIDPRLCGDEAALIHDQVPGVWIGVGAKRVEQFRQVIRESKKRMDLVILDDGFQHWKIKRDLDIVALTSRGRENVFFRNWNQSIRRAGLMVWTKGEKEPKSWNLGRKRNVPGVRVKYELENSNPSGAYWLVSGVADGDAVLSDVKKAGYKIKNHLAFPDHADYAPKVVAGIVASAEKARVRILLTGKDWVKWRQLDVPQDKIEVIEPRLIFPDGKTIWEQVVWGSSC